MADISRADALALLATQELDSIIKPETSGSAALAAFRSIRMSAGTVSMPVLAALPTAGWVTDDTSGAATGTKPTSKVSWTGKNLVAEEIAVIVPVHENTIADSRFDIWGEVRPLVSQEFGRVLDEAVFFGVNKPATWLDPALVPGAIAAGNTIADGTGIDLADDINEAFGFVEDDEFDVNVAFTGRFLRRRLRGLRDADNAPIYLDGVRSDNRTAEIYGQDLMYVGNRSWDRDEAVLLAGDRSKVLLGIREDVQVKLLTEATIGGINLAEKDMVALRFKFRVAYSTAFSTAGGEVTDYPFAVITPDVTP
ncbi:major capsid protein [Microbacterium phage Martin]|uniref:Major capsid protein n=29 Tax=Ilzatvirus TaxID=2560150 RepID=A0A2L0HMV3_9CAUD|nr:major capsid protein [Microbacterium phage MonChoix]YP_009908708.1 major capsid protein [Microbacterium phage Teagan]8ECO_A Chain A, Major capsid protein [Microbacterium phage Oxtober96]8ECO_B Chain B, Major capsid protein [Microbacterium phage Oxtober96]8ECO_C Chain C, Major capsid protein [Microbacterium phage Oxtober96]8ECO_D Chain D, Major capsid protein [Microbacterium phage Oxtober96]8ECO_E Chain E, Major capsid protein [Microbacterium phage Oxtober96]8ECO_F Chain F, Major capsid pr